MKSRPGLETLSIYLLLALIGLFVADFTILSVRDMMLPTAPPPGRTGTMRVSRQPDRGGYNVVTTRNIFNADGKIPDPVASSQQPNKPPADGPPMPSQLPLQLVGTIVHINPKRSIATITLKSKNDQLPFKVDDVIPENLATVTKIERNKVTFRNTATQRLEYIEMKDDSKINFGVSSGSEGKKQGEVTQVSETEFELKRDDVNKLTGNLPELLQQARAIPYLGPDGQPAGFRIMEIQPGSIYERLGIKTGDIIKAVNGENVDSPAKAMELYNALRTSAKIDLQIERNGRRESLNFNITN